jgi:hypothetical protein
MLRNVSSGTAILLFALVNVTTLPTTVKAQGSNVECKKAVANAKSRLQKIPNVLIEDTYTKNLNQFYSDFPKERPIEYVFYLTGPRRKGRFQESFVIQTGLNNVANSPQLMKNISQDIISKCSSFGAVNFGVAPGCGFIFGVMPDGKLKMFEFVDHDQRRWGETTCN